MTPARFSRVCRQRLRSVFGKHGLDDELSQELAFHFEQLVQENLAEGMSDEESRYAASRALGNWGLLEEQCRDHRRVTWLHDLRSDLIHGWRMMRKNPSVTTIALASMAVAIGGNTAVLGAIDSLAFGRLPYGEPERLVMIRAFRFDNPAQEFNASVPDYFALKDHTQAFETIGISLADQKNLGGSEDGTPPEKISGQAFSPGVFEALGVRPMLGRTFTDSDFRTGPSPVIVLSYGLWQRRFGSDPSIVNHKLSLNGIPAEVIGVMPSDFRFAGERSGYWVPMLPRRTVLQAGVRYQIVAARLNTEATLPQAQAEVDRVAAQLARDFPDSHSGWGARVVPMREAMFGWLAAPLLTMEGAVVLVLLIACANVAGLLLARGESRRQEFAMRAALGAGRGRIVRQLLTESLMLSLAAGALGLIVAWLGLRVLVNVTPPPGTPLLIKIPLTFRMLLLTGLTSIVAAVVFGAAPALAAFRHDLTATFKESSRFAGTPRRPQRLRTILVAAQIAFAFILLIGSGLLLRSYGRLAFRDLNLDPRHLLTFEFRLPFERFMTASGEYQGVPYMAIDPSARIKFEAILKRLREVPGIGPVAGISYPPVNSPIVPTMAVTVEGARSAAGNTAYFVATPNLFQTLRTPLIRGRDFDEQDTADAGWVALINETAARQFWPGQDAIGKRFTIDSGSDERPREVIGIVRDIPTRTRSLTPEPVIYASYLQQPSRYRLPWATLLGQMTFILRTSGDPMQFAASTVKAVAEIDLENPVAGISPIQRYTEARMEELFLYSLSVSVFGFLAASLAAIGIYGALSYAVAQRTHEIGIRISVGASRLAVAKLVGQWVMFVTGAGLLVGVVGALSLTRLLQSQLWQVEPTDPAAFIGACGLLSAAAVAACIVPVRRALGVDPTLALRSE